jgi:AcrR family transcriptional regulator
MSPNLANRTAEVLPRRTRATLRDELRASQRGRLICAIADSVAAKGYAATTVGDVISLARVSRKTFYEHFDDKESCFLAAYDHGSAMIYEAIVEAASGLEDWREILQAFLSTWLELLAADLAFTRAYMIEFWAAGDAARARWKQRRDGTAELLKMLHERIRSEDPTVAPASDMLIAAVVGGINRLVISHVLADDPTPLTDLEPELERFVKVTLASHESDERWVQPSHRGERGAET